LASAPVRRLPMKPEAPVISTRRVMSLPIGQRVKHQPRGQQADTEHEEIDKR
jgi:hypothetical protein